MEGLMSPRLAQRRAAKALRRKALVRAKRRAELAAQHTVADMPEWGDASLWVPAKLSAAVIDLAEPMIGDEDDPDLRRNGVVLAIIAWNLSLLPPDRRSDSLRMLLEEMPELTAAQGEASDRSAFEAALGDLIARKEALYPYDRRFVVDYRISETRGNWRLTVTSTLAANPDAWV
jgi:hypothetical protein